MNTPIERTAAARKARAAIWLCGDGRYRVSVGGTFGRMLDGAGTIEAARAALTRYLKGE